MSNWSRVHRSLDDRAELAREWLTPPSLIYPAVPLFVFAVVSLLLWRSGAVRQANDTPFFWSAAEALTAWRVPSASAVPYFGYIVFVSAFQILGLGPGSIVFAQWLISLGVVVAIYDLGRRLANPLAGSLAATLYALNADITRFTFYVLSDSLFASLLLLALYSTYRAATGNRRWQLIAAGATLGVAVFRVNGWLMSPILFEWLIRSRVSGMTRWLVRIGVGAGYAACILIGLSTLNTGAVGYELLRTGRVIWFDPESWIVMPPSGPPASGWSPAMDYVWQHPLAVTDLMTRRVMVELAHTRRFYSRRHNVIAGITVSGLYLLAGIGWYTHRHAAITRVTILLVCVQLVIVATTAADWDGRFLIAVLPLVTVWSGVGLARLLSAAPPLIGRGCHERRTT